MTTSLFPKMFQKLFARNALPNAVFRPASAAAALTASACAVLASCASAPPYNPNHLSADQLSQVGEVCQNVLGFRASEPLTDNLWPYNPDSSSSTNRYQGCIATLSNTLSQAELASTARQAEQDCRLQGFVAGSSGLARCVLGVKDEPGSPSNPLLASLDPKPLLFSSGGRSSGAPATASQEQQACADIGIDPYGAQFASCVQSLKSVAFEPYFQSLYTN
jgi:hypothetical protein